MEQPRALMEILEVCLHGMENSKEGLDTYTEDSEADHGDGQQVGRETAYKRVAKLCCTKLLDIL